MVTTCTAQHKDTGNVLPKRYNSKFTEAHESIPTVLNIHHMLDQDFVLAHFDP